jgi:hypothetical protein
VEIQVEVSIPSIGNKDDLKFNVNHEIFIDQKIDNHSLQHAFLR